MTSCIDWPRTASGDCSPIAHSTASVTLDLPEPLGPTMTETPGPNSSRVRSGKDLKPLRVSDLRCTAAGQSACVASDATPRAPARAASCSACFFERPEPAADARRRRPSAATSKVRSCGGPCSADDLVLDELAAPRQALLQRGLEVDRVARAPPRSRAGRPRRPPSAVALVADVQVAGADDRLGDRGQHALGLDQRLGGVADALGRVGASAARARPSRSATSRQAGPADGLGADLGQPAGAEALGLQARVQPRGDGQARGRCRPGTPGASSCPSAARSTTRG